jgi:(2Fe-2S) ferredoxin
MAFHYGAVAAIFAILVAAAGIVAIVGIVGIFFATLARIGKKEKVVAAEPEEEREKGLLVIKQFDKEGQVGPCVEKKPSRYPYVSLKPEEIKAIVREEVEQANDEEAKKIFKSPIVFAIPTQVKEVEAEQPAEEKPAEQPAEEKPAEEKKETLSEEQIRLVVAQDIAKAIASLKLAKKPAKAEEPVEEAQPEPVEEQPAEEPAPVEEPVVEAQPEPEQLPEEEPVYGEAGVPVVEEGKTVKAVRVPFTDRINQADDSLKDAFNQIKSLLKAYGLNDRVSNGGDAFRLHRVTYCKVTVAGKALKLYLALNPADYANSTYPVKDASSKAMYAETPLVFKVKSGLSLRRAEELIRDCMDKNGLEQVDQVEPRDWVAEICNAETEEGEADDEE